MIAWKIRLYNRDILLHLGLLGWKRNRDIAIQSKFNEHDNHWFVSTYLETSKA